MIPLARKLCKEIEDYEGIDIQFDAVVKGCGHDEIVSARYTLFFILYNIKKVSYTKLAREFGRKSHSAVNRGINTVKKRMEVESFYKAFIEQTIEKYKNERSNI